MEGTLQRLLGTKPGPPSRLRIYLVPAGISQEDVWENSGDTLDGSTEKEQGAPREILARLARLAATAEEKEGATGVHSCKAAGMLQSSGTTVRPIAGLETSMCGTYSSSKSLQYSLVSRRPIPIHPIFHDQRARASQAVGGWYM